MGTHGQLRSAKIPLAVCVAVSGLALAGCSAATAGAAGATPSASPAGTGAQTPNFAPFPIPPTWSGGTGSDYTMAFRTVTGTTPREFSVTATSSLVFWLGCIGTGSARIVSAPLKLNWSVPCVSGNSDGPTGITLIPPRAAVGTAVQVKVTASPGSRWEFRVDVQDANS